MNKISTILAPLSIIFFAVILRLLPHPANFAPIGALALFGGVYLNKKYALILPLLVMLISDFFLGFHNTMIFVYGSFILMGLIGIWIRKNKNIKNIVFASIFSSILFFIVTNFGVWVMGWYPKTFQGLISAYVLAIPFFRNTIMGDLFYTGVFFGAYELVLASLNSKVKTQKSKIKA
ncbi:MAG: hypothetical protein M1450_00010 [Patescibacteria group bacterium]|nr:hypothetical protein [Patescibacteria group bacterium]